MKKILLGLLVILLIFSLLTYILIPANLTIDSVSTVKTTENGTERYIVDEGKWGQWWQIGQSDSGKSTNINNSGFNQHGYNFQLTEKFYKSAGIRISKGNEIINSKLFIIRLALDSTDIDWKCTIQTGINPIIKFARYLEAKKIKRSMDAVLSNLALFLSKNENIYGISVERNFLKDTLYVTAKKMVSDYPNTATIYALINTIQQYTGKNQAQQTGSPIYNVTDFGNNQYQLMAGIPVAKKIPEKEGFSLKHMVRGSFMITEVVGGNAAINNAAKNLQLYFSDFNKTSMAMNFTMLVTDRVLQPDSAKWITKLYQPVY